VNHCKVIRNILQRGKISDGGASKKIAGLFIRNLVKLVNLAPDVKDPSETVFEEGIDDAQPRAF
jgi:hypothetical protein